MADISSNTAIYKGDSAKAAVSEEIDYVCAALREKGYNPIDQLVGYLLSGDPTYITSHNDARTRIRGLERYELLEELVASYLGKK